MCLSAPSIYMSSPDPRIFGSLETVIADASTGKSYTPSDFQALFETPACTGRARSRTTTSDS